MEVNGNLHASAALSSGKKAGTPWKLGWPHSRPGRFEKDKILLSLPWFEPRTIELIAQSLYPVRYPDSPTIELIAQSLYSVRYPDSLTIELIAQSLYPARYPDSPTRMERLKFIL